MAHLHDAIDGSGERVRARALVGEDSAAGAVLEKRQEQFGVAFFEFSIQCRRYIWLYHISGASRQYLLRTWCLIPLPRFP